MFATVAALAAGLLFDRGSDDVETDSPAATGTPGTEPTSDSEPAAGGATTAAGPTTKEAGGAATTKEARAGAGDPTSSSSAALPSADATLGEAARACVASYPVDSLAGQVVLALADARELDELRPDAAAGRIGGVVMLGDPTDAASLRASIEALTSAAEIELWAMVDEEGGRVQRLAEVTEALPSAAAQADLEPGAVQAMWNEHGRALDRLGFDVVLAPVVDIGDGPAIGDRSFGSDAPTVQTYAAAVTDGLHAAGLLATYKHFPGHGRVSADSHELLPTAPPLDELRATDLAPYRNLDPRRAAVMVGHLAVEGLTRPDEPASLTPAAYALLRGELGFDGVVMTDALNMGAVALTPVRAGLAALAAGADMVMVPAVDAAATQQAIVRAVDGGEIDSGRLGQAAYRVLRAKGLCG